MSSVTLQWRVSSQTTAPTARAGKLETVRRIPCGGFALRVPREICFNSADPHNHHALQWRVSWPCRCPIPSCERRSRRRAASTVIAGQLTRGKRPRAAEKKLGQGKPPPRELPPVCPVSRWIMASSPKARITRPWPERRSSVQEQSVHAGIMVTGCWAVKADLRLVVVS